MIEDKNERSLGLEPLDEDKIEKTLEHFSKEYKIHKRGLLIIAPSGTGKTYFCKHQPEKDWIDGDSIWTASGAHPNRPWWLEGLDVITEVDKRSDEITVKAKEVGLWIMGASNNWLKPDAIVVPDWEDHVKLIKHRESTNYDGGAKSDPKALAQVKSHISQMMEWTKEGVPVFKSIAEAVSFLTSENEAG